MAKSVGYSSLSTIGHKISCLLAYPLLLGVYVYRYTLSPIMGSSCRFYPTCSHYAEDALRKHGAFKGSVYTVRRLLRCHPWHEGGYDPVE
ncbi:MAG: membrane protein insertion efficiency factor YidD [Candidatus Zixiibacteriota bacterium]|nr:MAG: membrane protein insertion efficiency factor YidD [candidate division Zixibacteria bacterium]